MTSSFINLEFILKNCPLSITYLFMFVWTDGYLFYSTYFKPLASLFFYYTNCLKYVWNSFKLTPWDDPICFWAHPTFWHHKMFQAHHVLSWSQPWIIFPWGIEIIQLVSGVRNQDLEEGGGARYFFATRVSLFLGSLNGRARNYRSIPNHTYRYTFLYFHVHSKSRVYTQIWLSL